MGFLFNRPTSNVAVSGIINSDNLVNNFNTNKVIADNAVVAANIIELVSSTVIKIADSDTAESIKLSDLTKSAICNIVAKRIEEKLLA